MTYIIAEPCIDIKDRSCVDLCPVDCIHEFERIVRGLRARVPGRCDLPRGRPPRQVGGVCADQLRVPRPREDQRARRRLRRRAQRPEHVRSKHVRRTRTPRSRPRCTSARQRSARTSRTSSRSWGCATAFRRSCWPMSPASFIVFPDVAVVSRSGPVCLAVRGLVRRLRAVVRRARGTARREGMPGCR